MLGGDAIGTPKAAVEVIAVQSCQGIGTDERLGLGLELAAQHHGAHTTQGEMLSMEHGIGHIGDTLKARKVLDELEGRGARIDIHKAIGLQQGRRTGADTLLVIVMEITALADRQVARHVRAQQTRRASVHLGDTVRAVERLQVTANGGRCHAQGLGKLRHGNRASLLHH